MKFIPLALMIMDFLQKDLLKEIIADTRKYKSENGLSMRAEIEEVIIKTDRKYINMFKQTINDIKASCSAKEIKMI